MHQHGLLHTRQASRMGESPRHVFSTEQPPAPPSEGSRRTLRRGGAKAHRWRHRVLARIETRRAPCALLERFCSRVVRRTAATSTHDRRPHGRVSASAYMQAHQNAFALPLRRDRRSVTIAPLLATPLTLLRWRCPACAELCVSCVARTCTALTCSSCVTDAQGVARRPLAGVGPAGGLMAQMSTSMRPSLS